MRAIVFLGAVSLLLSSGTALAGPTDSVTIIDPLNNAYFPDVPSDLVVVVEALNKSALVFDRVGLRVDNVEVPDQSCAGPGTCEFMITLDEGEHTLRAFVERNIGPELGSPVIKVQIGGDPPVDPTTDTTGGEDTTTGAPIDPDTTTGAPIPSTSTGDEDDSTTAMPPESSNDDAAETTGPAIDDDRGGGCGCRATSASWRWAAFALFGLALRRRRVS